MEVIRVEKNSNYTTISNVFLKDLNLSLKTKGFMAMVMALPSDWKFTVGGMRKYYYYAIHRLTRQKWN